MTASAEALKATALSLGFTAVGIASADPPETLEAYRAWLDRGFHGTMTYLAESFGLRSDPGHLLPGARSVIAVALNYHQPLAHRPGQPRIARYALGRDYHRILRGRLRRLVRWGNEAWPDSSWRVCVDSAPILEREYAHRAGLGWFGKNTMLIDSRRGSWFVIGLLLTTVNLPPDAPALGGCGTCRACIEACPTGAIVYLDGRWQVDARRCVSYLTIEHRGDITPDLQSGIGDWTFGCDVCQEVCPFNQPRPSQPLRAAITEEPDFLATRPWPDLARLATVADAEWDELTLGSAVRRATAKGLRRNAQINLANQKSRASLDSDGLLT